MSVKKNGLQVSKLETGIAGFDFVAGGGLPKGRTTLLAGTAGSSKTVFAAEFIAQGIVKFKENGVFITFEESPADICRNMKSLGWNIEKWVAEDKFAFVDASPDVGSQFVTAGEWDLGALVARIEHAVKKVNANISRHTTGSFDIAFPGIMVPVAAPRDVTQINDVTLS